MTTAYFPIEVTESCLDHIDRFDGEVNAYVTVMADSAQQQARAVESAIRRGDVQGLLAGMPVSVKDCIDVAGVPCTNGTEFFRHYVPNEDASIVSSRRCHCG